MTSEVYDGFFSVHLPEAFRERLIVASRELSMTRSAFVRMAVCEAMSSGQRLPVRRVPAGDETLSQAHFMFRVGSAMRQAIHQAAGRHDESASEFVRMALERKLRQVEEMFAKKC